jgi:hypothetical protein
MTNWTSLAAALDPPVPPDALPKVTPVLEALEAVLQPMEEALPIDTLPWTCPGRA